MRKSALFYLGAVGVFALLTSSAWAGTIFSDGFESYTTINQVVSPGAWGDGGGTTNTSMLETGYGNPGNDVWFSGGSGIRHLFAKEQQVTNAAKIVLQFDLWDDSATSNKRIGMQLTDNYYSAINPSTGAADALSKLLQIGVYTASTNPTTGASTGVNAYGFRTVNLGATGQIGTSANSALNWTSFPGTSWQRVANQWVRFKMEIGETTATFSIDHNADGSWEGTYTANMSNAVNVNWKLLSIGMSNLASAGGGAAIDNVLLTQTPEPMSLALLGIGCLFLRRRRSA